MQNRIDEIRKITDANYWNYCKTSENPADIITRSNISPSILATNQLWWEGPLFIKSSKDHWFKEKIDDEKCAAKDIELKSNIVTMVMVESTVKLNNVIDIQKLSTLTRLVRVTAWVLRFVINMKCKLSKIETKLSTTLSTRELKESKTTKNLYTVSTSETSKTS